MTVERAGNLVSIRIDARLRTDDARFLASDLVALADVIDAEVPVADQSDITAEISAALERLPDDVSRWTKADVIQVLGRRLARAGYKRRAAAEKTVKPVTSTVTSSSDIAASVPPA